MRAIKMTLAVLATFTLTLTVHAQTLTVVQGDTLSKIAQRELGSPDRWQQLCEANKSVLPDCDLLPVGTILNLPIVDGGLTLASAAAPVTVTDKSLEAVLECQGIEGGEGFNRQVALSLQEGRLSLLRGTPGELGYEKWDGQVNEDGAVNLTGEYIEGSLNLKPVSFTANVEGGVVTGSGTRGPRECTFTAQ